MFSFNDYVVSDEVVLYCITCNFYIAAAKFHTRSSHAFLTTCQPLGPASQFCLIP
jgi:hypothetical protein